MPNAAICPKDFEALEIGIICSVCRQGLLDCEVAYGQGKGFTLVDGSLSGVDVGVCDRCHLSGRQTNRQYPQRAALSGAVPKL